MDCVGKNTQKKEVRVWNGLKLVNVVRLQPETLMNGRPDVPGIASMLSLPQL